MQQYLLSGHLNKIFAVSKPLWILTEALVCHLFSALSVLVGVRKQHAASLLCSPLPGCF